MMDNADWIYRYFDDLFSSDATAGLTVDYQEKTDRGFYAIVVDDDRVEYEVRVETRA
jgi:hypothetical protein